MLTELCKELDNWFIRGSSDVHSGVFSVSGGALQDVDDILQPNQYFRVEGSIFNDGVHQYGVDTLTDETFEGTVSGMVIPPDVVKLAKSISDWTEKYGTVVNSPYSSESWGGYSYTKASGGAASGNGGSSPSWQSVFCSKLNRWRKV